MDAVTHGICDACKGQVEDDLSGPSLRALLDRFPFPLIALDGGGCIVAANAPALALLGKDAGSVEGLPGGQAMECVYAALPGGCGHTLHCKGCTIRNVVMETNRSGLPHRNVRAYQDIRTPQGPRRRHFSISTEKWADRILLRIVPAEENNICSP